MKTASDLSATGDRPFADDEVAAKFAAYPASTGERLLEVGRLILDVAARTEGVGPIEEALRWGQPSYLTSSSGSGSTIRIDANGADGFAIYFICHTNLIATFRSLYPTSSHSRETEHCSFRLRTTFRNRNSSIALRWRSPITVAKETRRRRPQNGGPRMTETRLRTHRRQAGHLLGAHGGEHVGPGPACRVTP